MEKVVHVTNDTANGNKSTIVSCRNNSDFCCCHIYLVLYFNYFCFLVVFISIRYCGSFYGFFPTCCPNWVITISMGKLIILYFCYVIFLGFNWRLLANTTSNFCQLLSQVTRAHQRRPRAAEMTDSDENAARLAG